MLNIIQLCKYTIIFMIKRISVNVLRKPLVHLFDQKYSKNKYCEVLFQFSFYLTYLKIVIYSCHAKLNCSSITPVFFSVIYVVLLKGVVHF